MNSSIRRYFIIVLSGILFLITSLFPEEQISRDQLEARLKSAVGKERLDILTELARDIEEPQKSFTYGKEALELLTRFPNTTLQIDVLIALCKAGIYIGEYNESNGYADECLNLAVKTGHKKGQADALYYLGRINYYQGVYDRAVDYYSRARVLYEELNHQRGLADTLNAYGLVYWRLGDYSLAMEHVLDSCKIRESLKGTSENVDIDIAFSYNNIGLIYFDMGDYEKAMEFMLKGKRILGSFDNKGGIAIAVNNIAAIFREQGKYTDALKYYRESLQLNQAQGFRHGTAIALSNIGKVFEKIKDYPNALDYFSKSLKISKEINQQNIISNTSIQIGKIKRELGQYHSALHWVNQGLAIASKISVREDIRDANQELAEIYRGLKNYPKALYYLKKYKEINDHLFNETSSKKIAELQTRYQISKNKKEIDLLKKDKAIRELTLIRQRYFNYFILIVSLLAIIVGFVIYFRYRLKVKMTRALNEEILEHKQTTQKLQESEEKFRALAETSIVGIYISQNHVIKYVNPKFLAIFGAAMEETLDQNFLKFVYEEDRSLVKEKMNQRYAGSIDTPGYEFRGLTRDMNIIHLASYGGFTHYQGQPAVLETIIDITNRKKNVEKLLESHKLEAMGILTGGIAHDFNNILAIFVGYLEMVKEEVHSDSPAYGIIKKIEETYTRAVDLSSELTSFAKSSWITPEDLSLSSIFNRALEEYPELEFFIEEVTVPPDLRRIYGDERQLKQMIICLFRGASQIQKGKAGQGQGGALISISAENINLDEENDFSLQKGEYIRVFFRDSNRVIPEGQLEKIFEPSFFPVNSHNRIGMGLELAICRSIVRKHKGYITVTSEAENGIAFEVILPAVGVKKEGLRVRR
jgi:PAS domain S-box-containing protein